VLNACKQGPGAWEALMLGVAELARGIAGAAARGDVEAARLEALFAPGSLCELLAASPTAGARSAVALVAASLPQLAAAAEVRSRFEHAE
jgi:hypothetical protein